MRFRSLNIPAFGPFTGFGADYGDGKPDLHLVFGPNEAGKSSLLRAIAALLYGIPNRSVDNFLHEYTDLALSAEIESRDGARLNFTRVKGRKNTIRGADGVALDDAVLAPFLGGVDESYFNRVFGLDSDELQKGADSLLSRDGDLGQALLATGTGGTLVQQTLDQFIQRSEQYYKGRAYKDVSIRPAIRELKEHQRAMRENTIATRQWQQLERQLAEKQRAVTSLDTECSELERELDWIVRCQDALPTVAQLKAKTQQIAALPSLPLLADDFPLRARESRDQAQRSAAALQREQLNVARIQEQLSQCATAPAVLAEGAMLDDLHARMEVYRNRGERLAELRHEMSARESELATGMQAFGLTGPTAELEALRIAQSVQLAFEEAAEKLEISQLTLEANKKELYTLRQGVEVDEAALANVSGEAPVALQRAIDVAGEVRQLYRNLPQLKASTDKLRRELKQARALLPGVSADGEALAQLNVPTMATIRKYREQIGSEQRQIDQLQQERADLLQQQKECRADLQRLQQGGALPSDQALSKARRDRDAMWQQVVADWQASRDGDRREIDFALQLSYPAAVIDADRLADALRDDAEQVARAGQLQNQMGECQASLGEIDNTLERLRDTQRDTQTAWQAQWRACALQANSPAEMEEWREHWLVYRDKMAALSHEEDEIRRHEQRLADAVAQLRAALDMTDSDDFNELDSLARDQWRKREAAIGKRDEVQDRIRRQSIVLEQLRTETARLTENEQQAREVWNRCCRDLGLATGTSVRSGRKLLQQRIELLARYDEWRKLSVESAAIEKEVLDYEDRVDEYSARLAVGGESVLARQQAMWAALTDARQAQLRHNTLSDQLQHAQDGLDQAQLQARQLAERLDHFKSMAQLKVTEELEPLLARIEQRERLSQDAETHRQSLIGLARGEPVSEFMQRVECEDGELLASRRSTLEREKLGKREQLQSLRDEAGELSRELDRLAQAGDLAAIHSQRVESIAAGVGSDAREFIKLRIATAFLEQQREKYREQNQAPLLAASSELFKAVTLGSFERLAPDYDARDEAVIVGERADGSRVPVDGMSEGTRDQLYLSLRLAALAQHMKSSEPMPLIMDDLLMTFDNQRSRAMLRQMANLANHTQIFLFTHHRHLLELCHSELDDGEYAVHML